LRARDDGRDEQHRKDREIPHPKSIRRVQAWT
jgi:hypothetical protein